MSKKLNLNKKLDEKDLKIIGALKENARLSTYEIARKTGLPPTTVYNRMKQLDESHIIKKYTVEVDRKALGQTVGAYVAVNLDTRQMSLKPEDIQEFLAKIKSIAGVEEINYITGRHDLLLKIYAKDMDQLNQALVQDLKNIKGVWRTETMMILYSPA